MDTYPSPPATKTGAVKWPPPGETRYTRQKRITETLKFANSSKRKAVPKDQLQEILHKLQLDLKAEGNELFVEKEITKACLCYNEALSIMNLVTMEKMFEDVALEEIVLCNRAECLLRIGEEDGVEQALIDCENILNNMNPKNEKAMFRKVKALKKLGRVDEAWRAIQQLKLIRNDSKVIQLENEIRAIIDEQTLQYLEHRTRALVEAPMPENPEENAEVYDHDDIELMKNLYMMMRLGLLPPHPPAVSPIPPAAQDPMHHGKRTGSPNARGSESGSAKTSSGGVPLRNSGPGLGEPRYRFYSDISDSARGDSGFAEATLGRGDYEEEENKTWLASGTNGPDTQETETKGKKKKAKKKKKKKKKSKAASDFDDRDPNDQSMVSGPRDESEKGEVVIERDSTADGNYDSDTTTATLQDSIANGLSDDDEDEREDVSTDNQTCHLPEKSKVPQSPVNSLPWTTVQAKKQSKKTLQKQIESKTGLDNFHMVQSKAATATAKFENSVTLYNHSKPVQQYAVSSQKPAAEALNPPVPPNITVPPTVDLREMLETHDFALVCQQCYTQTPGQFGQESYKLNSNLEHTCWADTLLCTRKASRVFCWKKIRPRTNKKYQGKYWLCNEFEHEEKCGVREDLCYFCHSEEEIEFWTLERKQKVDRQSLMAYLKKLPGYRTHQSVGGDGVKNVSQMPSHPTVQPQMLLHDTSRRAPSPKPVTGPELTTPRPATPHLQIHATTMHRSQSPVPSHNKPPATPEQLKRLLEECGGQFVMCCKDCFMKSSRICIKSMGDLSQFCSANDKHPWKSNEMMMHVRQEGHDLTFFRIAQVPAQVATRTRFALCIHSYHRTIPQFRERCTFPHSAAEKSVWEFEAVTSTTRNQIVAASTYHASQPVITRKITITDKELKPKAQELMAPQLPFKLQVVCKACWTRTRQPVEEHRQQSGKCARGSHEWKGDNQEIIIFSERTKRWVPVNNIPRFIVERNQTLFQICKHSQRGKDHYRELMGRDCANPHSQEEMELWKWQLKNKVCTMEGLAKILKQKPVRRDSIDLSKPKPPQSGDTPITTPLDLARFKRNEFYCDYCNKRCNSRIQLQQHFTSMSHQMKVMSDKDREHDWNHRPPPWNVHEDNLKMCARESKQPNACPYGECTDAHSQDELDEWKERAEYRRLKRNLAKERHLFSFMDTLIEKYSNQRSGERVLSENLEHVDIQCDSDLVIPLEKDDNKTIQQWRFKLSSDTMQLVRVGLLYDFSRQHFHLLDGKNKVQIASGSKFVTEYYKYEVPITFESQIFGSFHQWVVFDFGAEPVLVKKLTVHVGSPEALEAVRHLQHQTDVKAWNRTNSTIIPFDVSERPEFDTELLEKYKDPSTFKEQTIQVREYELNRNNYKHQMHRLLNMEELSQLKILEMMNCKTVITGLKSISPDSTKGTTTLYAPDGDLYGKVELNQELSDDYEAGRILLRSVNTVLVKPCNSAAEVVYEAKVVSNEDFTGIDKHTVFIQLSKQFCEALRLHDQKEIEVEIQFRINRLPFCRQHYAVDRLTEEKLQCIFPHFRRMEEEIKQKLKKVPGLKMNSNQLKAVTSITGKNGDMKKPLIIYGPFGTGKTYTMAMSIKQLVTKQPDAKVLLCTISNSAADLYITEYFDRMVREGCEQIKPLRIYAGNRRFETIQEVVAKYCPHQEVKAGIRQVRMPNAEDVQEVKEYSVIVTTLTTSVVLQRIGLEGHFTHIFIDEAGQALETEAIMPITLARLNTKVVLAGDHQQMSPEVHSDHARKLKFDQSLLTRLFKAYIKEGSSSQPFRIMLDENYRCQENILKFISLLFYGKALIASSDPPQKRHPEIYPLAFYSASGEERIIGTSYYNTAEVLELAHRIESLCRNWPKEWGKKDLSTIGVISPYSSQVQQIRSSLRQRGLGKISVEHVLNVQGKEFRAVYISTVRTSKAVDTGESDVESLNLGFLSDKKLLNTALTRAQSLVAVVGDPIALCAIGKCSNNWRSFISECEKNQSIHPDTLTIESIEQQVLSEHRQLNPQAAEFIPLKKVKSQPAEHSEGKNGTTKNGAVKALYSQVSKVTDPASLQPSHVSQNQERHSRCSSPWRSEEKQRETKATQGPEDNKLKNRQQTTVTDAERRLFNDNEGSYDEWESDDEEDVLESLDIDEILQELARQLDETRRKYSEGRAFEDVADSDEEVAPAERNTTIRNREGMSYRHNFGNRITSRQQRRIGADHDEDYDSDSDDYVWNPYENETLETDETTLIKEYSPEDLREKISSEPLVYKRCKLYVDPTRTYAVTLDETEDQEIEITTKLKRGRALNNDEVVVEILNCASDFPDDDERKEKTYGTVVGILERAVDPRLQKIACIIDEHSPNLMAPINRNLPKMIWIQPRDDTKSRSPNIIPICTMTKGGDLKIKRHEKVTNKDRPNKVFLVRFLRWHPQYRYPICVVIDVLPYGDTLATGTAILKSEYGVKATYKTATKRELARMYPDKWSIPSSEYQNRKNLQHLDVFTVDPAESTDLDDALSVERLSHNKYRVGIHIADVSFFVHPSSELDKEAFRRATSHYPWKQNPIHMLPPQLSTKLCSLIPGKDRLALTLFLTMTEDAEISDQNICRSIIRSRSKLSYEDAEKAINGDQGTMAITDSIKESIDILHGLTCKLQAQRLGDGRFCCNYENHDVATSPQAHSMVEELMLQANMQVASLLVEVFPHCTPLRRQKPPRDEKLAEWKKKHGHQISNSLDIATKSDLLQLQEYFKPGLGADVDVLNTVWEQVVGAVQVDDLAELKKIILDDQNHPQLAVMSSDYRKIQERSIYTSSKNISEERSHFSLNVSEYTHFTSPIRRYIDIVVHRLVIAYLTEQAPPYSETNITEICKNCNQQALFAKEFERAMMALHIATTLKEKPVRSLAFIDSTSDGDIHLQVPEYNIHIPSSQRVVKFNTLQPCEQPNIDEENTPVTLKWKARIYERRADEDVQMGLPPVRRIATAVLPPDRFVKHVPGSLWQEMMACLINNKRPNLRTVLHRISIILNNPMTGFPLGFGNQLTYCTEVTSEGIGPDNLGDSKHFCQYERTYACGEVVEVQLSTKIKKGTLTPDVQLFNLTPKLDVCIEHRGDPIYCFAEVANERTAILRNKRSITEYQRIWRKLIAMSAAHSAVTAGENVTIHTMGIQWSKCDDRDDTYEGLFRLPTEFCMNRHIKFNGARIENKSMNKHYDFVCVRYRMTDSDQTYKKSSDEVSDRPNGFCWVSHCVTTAAERYDDFVEVHILINQTRTQFPDRLLHQRPSKLLPCTIEWIPQTMPDRRVKEAMEKLKNASKFIQDICLGRKISMDDSKIALTVSDTEIKSPRRPFYKLNPVQDQAVKTALFKPFTLIQGPPGTGKTVTGVHIANWFVYLNGQVRLFDHRQVMYCGPSNKSVDVVTAYLKKIAHIKIVRVYSESIERQYFPVPGMPEYPLRSRGGEVTMSEEHKDVALHFLIRQSTNPFHQQIKNFDKIFRDPGYSYNREDEMNYRGLVKEAEKIVLQQSDVILCTCVTAGARRIAEGTRIQQCIIDECGMCTEPETIVPLVTTEPKQVVLIGDHKQLRPIVTEEMSKKLGMEISVLERYEKKAMMLTMQYRMHPGICRFPSEHFYDGKLETAAQVLHRPRGLNIWPGGEQNPTVFCHIVGTEERLTVSTSEGSEQSRSNLDEVEQVVRMAITLVVRHFVNPASIIILSQYRAQCSEITKRLEAKGHANIAVNTVIVSQGSEWDYVIFSTVRSLPKVEIEEKPSQGWLRSNLGFITDEHQINVAITRAKRGLIIVGNRELLGTHGMWKNLLRKYEQDRCLVQAKDFLQLPMR